MTLLGLILFLNAINLDDLSPCLTHVPHILFDRSFIMFDPPFSCFAHRYVWTCLIPKDMFFSFYPSPLVFASCTSFYCSGISLIDKCLYETISDWSFGIPVAPEGNAVNSMAVRDELFNFVLGFSQLARCSPPFRWIQMCLSRYTWMTRVQAPKMWRPLVARSSAGEIGCVWQRWDMWGCIYRRSISQVRGNGCEQFHQLFESSLLWRWSNYIHFKHLQWRLLPPAFEVVNRGALHRMVFWNYLVPWERASHQ